jgi:nicotinate-nucleotide--dimethylbenzimidazole phosphoribosyltransferase
MADLLNDTIKKIGPLDQKSIDEARARQDTLTKPQGSLGRLEELSIRIAGIQGKSLPQIRYKAVITMAGDHGVVSEGVGNWPQDVTAQMVTNFLHGGAGINVIARQAGARVVVVDMGVVGKLKANPQLRDRKIAPGTRNIAAGPAMTMEQAVMAIEAGIEVVQDEISRGLDIVGTGDMGIGNTTPSAAICAAITGKTAAEVTGRGTGIDDKQLAHKVEVVNKALSVNHPDSKQPLDVLAKVGGFEIGGLAGVMLGAAANHIPVVIDGFISGAAALIATSIAPQVKEYLISSHLSAESGHKIMLNHMGLRAVLDLDLRLGEGTGAALGIMISETAVKLLVEMATFAEAEVSEKNEA